MRFWVVSGDNGSFVMEHFWAINSWARADGACERLCDVQDSSMLSCCEAALAGALRSHVVDLLLPAPAWPCRVSSRYK